MEVNRFVEEFFQEDPYQWTTHDNWHLFKTTIMDIIKKCVPFKEMKSHRSVC